MRPWNKRPLRPWMLGLAGCGVLLYLAGQSLTQPQNGKAPFKRDIGKTTYDQIAPVILGQETFAERMAKDIAGKEGVMARQKALLEERYDLGRKVDEKVTMTR